ncbi:MAG TPA: SIS domain-containing protein [candidate division Zixibacteria bacterium]|nr:SIS domain-containing protein [candidate division Zixibacteria bacterium]
MKSDEFISKLRRQADETSELRRTWIEEIGPRVHDLAAVTAGVIGSGGKLLIAGNGGSASDASHFAAEMVVRLTADRNRQALPAIALGMDPSVVTAASNDFGFENMFARQTEALGNKGDLLLVISTSGNSANLLKAVTVAREKGILTAGLLGGNGGRLAETVDRSIIIPHTSTQRIQEEHIFIIHTLVETIEADLFG